MIPSRGQTTSRRGGIRPNKSVGEQGLRTKSLVGGHTKVICLNDQPVQPHHCPHQVNLIRPGACWILVLPVAGRQARACRISRLRHGLSGSCRGDRPTSAKSNACWTLRCRTLVPSEVCRWQDAPWASQLLDSVTRPGTFQSSSSVMT